MTEALDPISRPRSRRRVVGLLGALAAGVLMPMITAAPAQAATARNGVCESGEFCYYYNSDNAGSVSDFSSSVPDLGATQPSCYDFKSSGNGQGVCVKNHAASVRNRTGGKVTVYFNSGYGGMSQTIASGADANLVSGLKNENASHLFAADDGTWTQAFIVREENRSGFSASNVTAYQAANIKFIIAVGKGYGISAKGIETAIATSIVSRGPTTGTSSPMPTPAVCSSSARPAAGEPTPRCATSSWRPRPSTAWPATPATLA